MSVPRMTPASGPPDSYATSFQIDPRYVVTLTVSGEGGESFVLETTMDETLALSLGSQWAAPFENVMQEVASAVGTKAGIPGRVSTGTGIASEALGLKVKSRETSFQTWQSSDPMQFSIPFTLVALKDPVTEIKEKSVKLLKLVAPTQKGPILCAPGPTLLDTVTGGRNISLKIGQFLKLEPCIVTNVQIQYDNVIGEAGIPLRAKATVDIKSWYVCFTTQDIDKLFGNG